MKTMKTLIVAAFLIGSLAWQTTMAEEVRMCTMQYDPVCGADGRTYGNACSANSAGMGIAYQGECRHTNPSSKAPEFKNGNPFRNRLERNRIQHYAKKNISKIATNSEVMGGKFHVTKISWQPLNPSKARLLDIVYEDGHNRFEESFVAKIDGWSMAVVPVVSSAKAFTLKKWQKAFVLDRKVLVELSDLADSTCPLGVQCIWAGEKSLQMTYWKEGESSMSGKDLLSAFDIRLELLDSDYDTYAKFALKK